MTASRALPRSLSGVLTAVILLLVPVACSSSASGRPETSATLQIISPAPNATTGTDVDLRLKLENARIVPTAQVGGTIRPDRGHIHVSVDGQITQMYYGTHQTVPNLTPGSHTIQAEFVASDHAPFANRVVAAVTFVVQ